MKKLKLGKRDIFAPLGKTKETPKIKGKHSMSSISTEEGQNKKRQTYHMSVDLIPRIKEYAYFEKVKVSDVVNKGMTEFLKGYKPKINK